MPKFEKLTALLADESVYDSLAWETLDGRELGLLLQGLVILGAEPIDYPCTDGVVIYLEDRAGEVFVMETGADPFCLEEANPFYMRWARIPTASEPHTDTTEGD